jgi:L-asparaginase II
VAARKGKKALGIAFKIEDGSSRTRDAVTLDILARLGRLPGAARRLLSRHLAPVVRNVRGFAVGRIEAVVPLEQLSRQSSVISP